MKFAITKNDGTNFKRSNIFSAAREPILYLFNFFCVVQLQRFYADIGGLLVLHVLALGKMQTVL